MPSENAKHVRDIKQENVRRGAKVFTDESPAYATLSTHRGHSVVKHGDEFSADDGANENQAESYISRFRRMRMGRIHRMNRKYLDVYSCKIAFREDHRRVSNGDTSRLMLANCLKLPRSRDRSKYWQGNHRTHDSMHSYLRAL